MAKQKEFDYRFVCSDYMHDNFDPKKFRKRVENMEDSICTADIEFDCIACRGVSGLIMAAPLSFVFKKPLLVVRKDTKNCHSYLDIEGYAPESMNYIIVDDFTESGDTVRAIIEAVRKLYKDSCSRKKAVCVGMFMYAYFDKYGLAEKNRSFFRRNIKGPMMSA